MTKKKKDSEPVIPLDAKKNANINKSIIAYFCFAIVILGLLFIGYAIGTCSYMHKSTCRIIESYENHIHEIDSISKVNADEYVTSQKMLLSKLDSLKGTKAVQRTNAVEKLLAFENKQVLNTRFCDSISLKQEHLLVEQEIKNMVAIHLDKIDNDYTVITIWGAVLTIIFLVFSFYSIFKIEETKKDVYRTYQYYKQVSDDEISEVKKTTEREKKNIEAKSNLLQQSIDNMDKNSNLMIENKRGVIDGLIQRYSTELENSLNKLLETNEDYKKTCNEEVASLVKGLFEEEFQKQKEKMEG